MIGAFGEGFAMLAAAGGPDVHPHAVSSPEERARWDKDMLNFNDDLKKVECFGKSSKRRSNTRNWLFILWHSRPMVHGRLEDVGADRKNIRAPEVNRMYLRPAQIASDL